MMKSRMMALALMLSLVATTTAFADKNVANVLQVGNKNVSTVDQAGSGNAAEVSQFGTNFADVDQQGNGNFAIVEQGSAGKAVNNSYQPTYADDWKQGAYIDQVGDGNGASIKMTNSAIGAKIDQMGDRNNASQILGAHSSYTNASKPHMAIEIDQVGSNNSALQTTVASYGTYGIQDMLVEQNGDGNAAVQNSIGGMRSTMLIDQLGNNNISVQSQDGMKDVATATVRGNGNATTQLQMYSVWGDTNRIATIDIFGDANIALQQQVGVLSTADIDIVGTGNNAMQIQNGDRNVAKITQSGNGNRACQMQTGSDNVATITQIGNDNSSMINQAGSFNSAMVVQTN